MDWLARLAFLSCLLSRWDSLDGHNHVTPVTFGQKSCQTFDFICPLCSVLGNWDHWWTYDGISGPGMIACDGQYILTFIKWANLQATGVWSTLPGQCATRVAANPRSTSTLHRSLLTQVSHRYRWIDVLQDPIMFRVSKGGQAHGLGEDHKHRTESGFQVNLRKFSLYVIIFAFLHFTGRKRVMFP